MGPEWLQKAKGNVVLLCPGPKEPGWGAGSCRVAPGGLTWGLACSSSSPWLSSWDWRESEWDGGIGEKGARHRAGALSSCGTCRSQAPEAQQPHQQLFP